MSENKTSNLTNVAGAAELLQMPKSRIYYMVFHKQIPYIKVGSSLRFDKKDLENWLKVQKIAAILKEGAR